MNTKKILRQKIYKIVTEECSLENKNCSSNIIINIGKHGIAGEDAEILINSSADAMNIPREYIYNNFSYSLYFDKEINHFLVIFFPFIILCQLMLFIYRLTKNGLRILFKYPKINYKTNPHPPLTAQQFVDIMIDIWEQYQRENSKKCP